MKKKLRKKTNLKTTQKAATTNNVKFVKRKIRNKQQSRLMMLQAAKGQEK